MAGFDQFAFTESKIPQPSSFDASMQARLVKLERENSTLQRELRDANDANGVARVRAVAKNEAQEAQRETKRAQMAERIVREVADDLRNTRRMAQDSPAKQEAVVKLEREPGHSTMENGKPQVESETHQGLPANAPDSAGDTDIHAKCQRDRKELIEEFQKLCETTIKQHAGEIATLNERHRIANEKLGDSELIVKNNVLEVENDKLRGQVEELESARAKAEEQLEKLKEEVPRNAQELRSATSKLHILEAEHHKLLGDIEERVATGLAEARETSDLQQKELHDTKTRLDHAIPEIQGLKHEAEGYERELNKVRSESAKLRLDLEHQKQVEKHLGENNERLLADLQDERHRRKTLAVERDELAVQFAKTRQTLDESEKSEAEIREELNTSRAEFESAAEGVAQQHVKAQEEVDGLTTRVEQQVGDIATKDQHIDILTREIEVLKTQNEVLKKSEDMSQSQLAAGLVQKPELESTPRPNNDRSVSTVSHTSLAAELGSDHDQFGGSISEDDEYITEQVELGLSDVRHISIAPREIATPQLTVSVRDSVATTLCVRQDSPLEHSPVNSVSSIEPSHSATLELEMYRHIIADLAPLQPAKPASDFEKTVEGVSPIDFKPASLVISEITGVDCAPAEADATSGPQLFQTLEKTMNHAPVEPAPLSASASKQLTMHVFKHSVISVDPKSGNVVVTDPHTDWTENGFVLSNDMDRADVLLSEDNRSHWQKIFMPLPEHLKQDCSSSSCKNLNVTPSMTASRPRKCSPVDPYARAPKLFNPHELDQCTASWPMKDVLTMSTPTTPIDIEPIPVAADLREVDSMQENGLDTCVYIQMLLLILFLGSLLTSLLPVPIALFGVLTTSLQLYSALFEPVSPSSRKGSDHRMHYLLRALMILLAFFCWRFWSQLQAWEQANGVGFGEGFGSAYSDFGPYGNGHFLLSRLPLNWVSADSHLPAKALEVITSTVSAFEGWIGSGSTPAF